MHTESVLAKRSISHWTLCEALRDFCSTQERQSPMRACQIAPLTTRQTDLRDVFASDRELFGRFNADFDTTASSSSPPVSGVEQSRTAGRLSGRKGLNQFGVVIVRIELNLEYQMCDL
jgi:hypothetical protein